MPIPIYNQQSRAPGNLNLGRVNARQVSGAISDALGSVGRNIEQARALAQQKQEERAAVTVNESLMGSRAKWVEELPKRQQAAAESGEGYAASVLKDFDTDADERIQAAPTDQSKQFLRERLSQTRLALQEDSLQFEARRSVEYKASGLERSVDSARTAVEFLPQSFATVLAEQRAAIQASGLPAPLQAKLSKASQDSLASASIEGEIRRNPFAALRELNNEKTDNLAVRSLDFDRRQQLRNKAESDINRIESERRSGNALAQQELTIQLQDARAAASYGIPVTVPDKAKLTAAFGAVRGQALFADAMNAQRLSTEVGKLNQLSNAELQKLSADYTPTSQAGAADAAQLSGQLNQKIGQILEGRRADPVGYLQDVSPTVAAATQAIAENKPGSGQGYFNAVEAEKERLGIASAFVFPKGLVPGSNEYQQVALLATNKYRALPAESARFASNALKSEDPRMVAQGAQLLDAVANIAPAAYTDVPQELRARAAMVASMINAGAAPDRAVQTAIERQKLSDPVRQERAATYKKQQKSNPSALKVFIDKDLDPSLFYSQPAASIQLNQEFDRQAGSYFQQTGDIDISRELAWQDLQRVYGTSEVNGTRQVVAFPLERFTVTPAQVKKEVGELLSQYPQSDGSTVDEVTVVADSDTLRQTTDALSGQRVRPSYRMVTKTGDLVRDKDGIPLRYFIPDDEQILQRFQDERRKQEEAVSKSVKQARFDRETNLRLEKLRSQGELR